MKKYLLIYILLSVLKLSLIATERMFFAYSQPMLVLLIVCFDVITLALLLKAVRKQVFLSFLLITGHVLSIISSMVVLYAIINSFLELETMSQTLSVLSIIFLFAFCFEILSKYRQNVKPVFLEFYKKLMGTISSMRVKKIKIS